MHNLLLAGIPRSGTTLACALLNRLPNVAALPEPMDVTAFAKTPSPSDWIRLLDIFFFNALLDPRKRLRSSEARYKMQRRQLFSFVY